VHNHIEKQLNTSLNDTQKTLKHSLNDTQKTLKRYSKNLTTIPKFKIGII
jgi:hypothetical protein